MSRERPTKEERRKIKAAAKQLNTKLRLERQLSNRMRRLLKRQASAFGKHWNDSGQILNAAIFQEDLENILLNHYAKTASKFSPFVVDQINLALRDAGEEPIGKGDPSLLAALLFFMRQNVALSADRITETSNKEMFQAMDATENDAKEATKKLRARALPRSETIGTTETQKASEGAKLVTLEAGEDIARAGAIALIVFVNIKTWITRGDGLVREAHDPAMFQEVPANEPFFVGGQDLMYPGDTSLGASLWNIINCRCTALYSVRIR
ncbi:MAG: hypothetical protein KAJ19_18335 [Gammaproteobacteria bacterium]|nr:hypothetical protein [Gammaproteobacteria bacterium]